MLEELLAAEELVIGVLDPALAQHLVGEVVGVLEDRKPRHQPRRQWRPAGLVLVDRSEFLLEEGPVDRPRQLHQRVAHIDDRVQPRAQKVALPRLSSFLWPHRPLPMPRRNHDSRFGGILKNEIASFRGLKPQKLAISNAVAPGKPNPAQWLGRFFTAD